MWRSRAHSLGMLKITGVEPTRTALKEVLRSSWRALHWRQGQGEPLPTPQQRYVSTMKRKYDFVCSGCLAERWTSDAG